MANPTSRSLIRTPAWRRAPELGTLWGLRFVVGLASVVGRANAGAFLWCLALYYALASARARRASQQYLVRVGENATFGSVVRHMHTFARVAVDRLFFLTDRTEGLVVECHGEELLEDAARRKVGALLLGSHLGSFEAMRAAARRAQMPLSVLVDSRSAERLGAVLRELSPHAHTSVIPVDDDGIAAVLRVRACLERGELVAILGDRAAGREERNVAVEFLGAQAKLPVGPYVLAHALGCPVLLVFGLFSEPNRYDLYCERFSDLLRLDRHARAEAIRSHAQRYADRLAFHARSAPYNWFNFFEFWTVP